jgi:hypothetical protein
LYNVHIESSADGGHKNAAGRPILRMCHLVEKCNL